MSLRNRIHVYVYRVRDENGKPLHPVSEYEGVWQVLICIGARNYISFRQPTFQKALTWAQNQIRQLHEN